MILVTNICLERHVRPSLVSQLLKSGYGKARLILSVKGTCNHENNLSNLRDTTIDLKTKIVIKFEYIADWEEDIKVMQSSWHLDKHDPKLKISSIHPLYHYELYSIYYN